MSESMAGEKGIERRWTLYQPISQTRLLVADGPSLQTGHSAEVMPVADHLEALGEVEAELLSLRGELATLLGPRPDRKGATRNEVWIAAVAEVLGRAERAEKDAERLKALVKRADDSSESNRRKEQAQRELREATETQLQGLRADIATVKGHLEGYADSIEAFGVDGNEGEEKLWRALREDAEKLDTGLADEGSGA